MSKKCSVFPVLDEPYFALKNILGGNEQIAIAAFFNIYDNSGISKKFKDYYADKTGKTFNKKVDPKKLAEVIYDYYYDTQKDASNYKKIAKNLQQATYYGYVKSADREEGKHHVASAILNIFMNKVSDPNYEHTSLNYLRDVQNNWINNIINYSINVLGNKNSFDDILNGWYETKDPAKYIETILGGKEMSDTANNLYAVYQELMGNPEHANDYIDEVLCDSVLSTVRNKIEGIKVDSVEEQPTEQSPELNAIENGGDSAPIVDDDNRDENVSIMNSHGGHYTTFMKHLSERLKNYFNSLPKITDSTDLTSYDTNNAFGIGSYMDAAACTVMIYNKGPYDSVESMINQIEIIAETVPGYASFAKLVADLKADNDLALELKSSFGKIRTVKEQIKVDGNKKTLDVSNRRSNPRSQFLFDTLNNTRNYVLGLDHTYLSGLAVDLKKEIDSTLNSDLDKFYNPRSFLKGNQKKELENKIKTSIDELQGKVVTLFRQYYPNIPETSVQAFIKFNGRNSSSDGYRIIRDNLINLCNDVLSSATNSIETNTVTIADINRRLEKAKAETEYLKEEAKKRPIPASSWPNIKAIRSEEILSKKQIADVQGIVNKFLPYVDVKTQLNTPNAKRNNASDIINNNYIMRLNDVFDGTDDTKLLKFGKGKFRSQQYRYNPLLSTQDGVNEGIFDIQTGELKLSKGRGLVRFSLFDGAVNSNNDKAAMYSEMNKGDYGPSVLSAFFSGENQNEAAYFMRIPSDAPKTFIMHAPRYATDDLYTLDETDLNNKLNQIFDSMPQFGMEQLMPILKNSKPTLVSGEQMAFDIFKGGERWIKDMQSVVKVNPSEGAVKNGEEIYVVHTVMSGDKAYVYITKGTYQKVGNGNMIIDSKVVHVMNGRIVENEDGSKKVLPYDLEKVDFTAKNEKGETVDNRIKEKLIDFYSDELKRNNVIVGDTVIEKVVKKVNRNSKAYKILYNLRKQELLDAMIALDSYLEMSDSGEILFTELGELPWKTSTTGKKKDNTHGYKFYHINDGVFAKKNEDGSWTLTGNVFNKSKFTLYNPETNEDVNYMEGTVSSNTNFDDAGTPTNFFYGGVRGGLQVKREGEGNTRHITDIILSPEQEEITKEALDRWIADFAEMSIRNGQEYEKYVTEHRGADNLVNFGINYFITYSALDGIIEGNTFFYKDIQTFFKRTKEGQGSGTPYGFSDYSADNEGKITDIKDSYIEKGVFDETYEDENGNIRVKKTEVKEVFANAGLDIHLRTGFRGVTVANSIQKTFASLPPLGEILKKQYEDVGYSPEEAKDKADTILYGPIQHKKDGTIETEDDGITPKRRGGFSDTKVNDAQSYITFEEWVRRIAGRGQLRRYMPLIKKLLDPNYGLTKADIDEFVQVQKNFYYDMYFDEDYGIEVPRQIKNAEFVLVPKLIKGTQLEDVYNYMKESDIDQLNTVETSKAANEHILTLWDNMGNLNEADVADFRQNAKTYSQVFDYNYLYTQQETPQHMNDKNKAGVQIVKKLIDNIPEGHPLRPQADRFFKMFEANIRDSYEDLVRRLEIPLDENGNIRVDGETGNILGINLDVFLDKLKNEMARQGLDNNMLDYVTNTTPGERPIMEAITPLVLSKFESVVQSVFNNAITRQKLPGFHAAQVTNIGMISNDPKPYVHNETGKRISKVEYDNLSAKNQSKYHDSRVSYSKDLRYHPDGKGYIEIKVPASIFNFKSDKNKTFASEQERLDYLLKELQDAGLDEIVGYRIPTEGKQSVCNMKIVGLLDESYGSTIVVPNEWVAQTGSDFDIDSVYTIQYETYYDNEGRLRKTEYKESFGVQDYISYVKRQVDEAREIKSSPEIKAALESLKDEFDNTVIELANKETEAYQRVNEIGITQDIYEKITGSRKTYKGKEVNTLTVKDIIMYVTNEAAIHAEENNLSKKEKYLYQTALMSNTLNDLYELINEDLDDEDYNALVDFINATANIYTNLTSGSEEFNRNKEEAINKAEAEKLNKIENLAKQAGLLSYSSWSRQSTEMKNSRKARNNEILNSMWTILNDKSSLEENLSRSNFDDITDVLNQDYLPNEFKKERKSRTAYNVFDQIKFQEDAMSGAMLKGMSVALDGFCSICNRVHANVEDNHQITIVYNREDVDSQEMLSKRFNVIGSDEKTITIRHNTYGWSKNGNRNVVGKLLTPYSSETTAYILDAIKEGAIPNVNTYTFTTYKTLLNMGMDYKTAITFMMQPGVSRVVEAYTDTKSIYSDSIGNPIQTAIKNIAKELRLKVNSRTSFRDVLYELNRNFAEDFKKQFGIGIITDNQKQTKNIPIVVSKLIDRLNNTGEFKSSRPVEGIDVKPTKEQLIYDLGIIILFDKIRNTANSTSSIARCLTSDKFGAKATVFETREVFDNISRLIWDVDNYNKERKERPAVLTCKSKTQGEVNILKAIYPGVEEGLAGVLNNMNPSDSVYPSLAAFLKYSTAFSISCAQEVLITERQEFVEAVNGLANMLSGRNPKLTEEEYNKFKKYLLSYFWNSSLSVEQPMIYRKDNHGNVELVPNHKASAFDERIRIFGYNAQPSLNIREEEIVQDVDLDGNPRTKTFVTYREFKIADINNPTEKEIEDYGKLSPAQKVMWIQKNFADPGVFGLYNANLKNTGKDGTRQGMQTITYRENSVSPNVAYEMFNKAFNSDNPLVKLAAIDIVKYATMVDGYKMSNTGVVKSIDNAIIYTPITQGGMGITDDVVSQIDYVRYYFKDAKIGREIYERYLRSEHNPHIKTRKIDEAFKSKYNIQTLPYGIYAIGLENSNDELYSKLADMGILEEGLTSKSDYARNEYIYLRDKKNNTTLYKIFYGAFGVYLYPLNALQQNETSSYSANPANNIHPNKEGLELFIAAVEEVKKDNYETKLVEIGDKVNEKLNLKDYYDQVTIANKQKAAKDFDWTKAESGTGLWEAYDKAVKNFTNSDEDLYIKNIGLDSNIPNYGIDYGSTQEVELESKGKKVVRVYRRSLTRSERAYLNGQQSDFSGITDNQSLRDTLENMKKNGRFGSSDIFVVTELNVDTELEDPSMESSAGIIEDLASKDLGYLKVRKMSGVDEEALSIMEKFRRAGIDGSNIGLGNNQETVVRELARYAVKTAQRIRQKLDHFVEDPNNPGHWLKINDERVQKLLLKDKVLTNDYLATINEARAFMNAFENWRNFDVVADDEAMQIFVKDIVDSYNSIASNEYLSKINTAEENFARDFVKNISNNPVIQDELVDILVGFHKTYGTMWRFHDVLENGTPLLQTIMKDALGNIEARRLQTESFIRGFRKEMKTIMDEASSHGLKVDFGKFITNSGRFVQDYTQEFVNNFEMLKQGVNDASVAYGLGSVKHLQAKLLYDKFKADYINQPAKPDYYQRRTQLEAQILHDHQELYSKYMKLYYQALDIYRYISDTGLNPEMEKKLHELSNEMLNLYRPGSYVDTDGNIKQRLPEDSIEDDDEKIYSLESAYALRKFLEDIKNLEDEYFEKKPIHGFEQQLQQNLQIIMDLEERDSNGIPSHTESYLMTKPEYRRAKEWIRHNARFQVDYAKMANDLPGLIENAPEGMTVGDYVSGLLSKIGRRGKGRFTKFNQLANSYDIHDEYGIPDATKLGHDVDEVNRNIAEIKEAQETLYNQSLYPPFSDFTMISSSSYDGNDIYNEAFYSHFGNASKTNEYVELVTAINRMVRPFYDKEDKTIHFERIPDTPQGIEILKQLANLYFKLDDIKKYRITPGAKSTDMEWVEENAETVVNKIAYTAQFNAAHEGKSMEWYKWWVLCNSELDDAGVPVKLKTEEGEDILDVYGNPAYAPNMHVYGYIKPKGSKGDPEYDRYVDHNKTEAAYVTSRLFTKTKTQYYYDTLRKAQTDPQSLGFNSYEEWYEANHIYNPYTHTVEPVECWLNSSYNEEVIGERYRFGEWVPKGSQYEKSVRDGQDIDTESYQPDMRNPEYNENGSIVSNYIKGANNGRYDNNIDLNDYEVRAREAMQNAIMEFALSPKSQRFFNEGYLPAQAKKDEMTMGKLAQEMLKLMGIQVDGKTSKRNWKKNISYETDFIPDIPMTSMLESKEVVELKPGETPDMYPNNTIKIPNDRPLRADYPNTPEGEHNWITDVNNWTNCYNEIKKHNEEVHSNLIDKRNWIDNITNFITYASNIKAVQENKQILYYLHNMLERMDMVNRKYGIYGDLELDKDKSEVDDVNEEGKKVYATSRDKELCEQYDNYLKRLFFNMFQEPTGKWTSAANIMQNFTSANYMMLNIRGGIANVTYGETQILAEAAAREYFGIKDWAFGKAEYMKGLVSYIAGMYDETSTTVQDAIIKYCNIVDYDEINGVVRTVDLATYSERLRNMMFSPQTAGEHFMQNSALFAMLHSHRLVNIPDDPTGIGTTYMNEAEYIQFRLAQELINNSFTSEQIQAFEAEKERVKKDLNEAKDYAWFRKDILTNFVYLHCTNEQVNKFIAERDKLTKKYKEEFNSMERMYDQLELGNDGKLAFKENSKLDELNEKLDDNGITYANNIMGRFINRARSVNNKIHGVYNRKGAAYIEKYWIGRLIMQYHKHIPMGLLKRYRIRGLFNEMRGTVEKGTNTSLFDFLTMPIDKIKHQYNLTATEAEGLRGIQNILKHATDFFTNMQMAYRLLPAYEKANMRRKAANIIAVLNAFMLMVLLNAIGDDDDDTIPFNLALYEVDRNASETIYYSPLGLMSETKKLASTPIAAQSIVQDAFKTMAELSSLILSGEDNGFYQTGRFTGRSKYRVFLERRLPGWAGIRAILDTPTNNHYFKLGQNLGGILNAKELGKAVRDIFN